MGGGLQAERPKIRTVSSTRLPGMAGQLIFPIPSSAFTRLKQSHRRALFGGEKIDVRNVTIFVQPVGKVNSPENAFTADLINSVFAPRGLLSCPTRSSNSRYASLRMKRMNPM